MRYIFEKYVNKAGGYAFIYDIIKVLVIEIYREGIFFVGEDLTCIEHER